MSDAPVDKGRALLAHIRETVKDADEPQCGEEFFEPISDWQALVAYVDEAERRGFIAAWEQTGEWPPDADPADVYADWKAKHDAS